LTQTGFTLWFTGLSGSGKSTLSKEIELRLKKGSYKVEVLDGDVVRTNLSKGLGFSREDRDTNIRRIGYVASEITKNGGIAICAPIAPYDLVRKQVRQMIEPPLAARAAKHAAAEDLSRLEDILRRQKEKIDRGELAIEEDSEFHYTIARAAKNSVVLKVLDLFMDLLRESRERSLQVEGRTQKSFAGHRRILTAICGRNALAAEQAMRRHIQEVERIVLTKM